MATAGVVDVAVIGGGIVGLATAKAVSCRTRATVAVLEAEDSLAAHQTGNNSGVIHSGLYYRPGSLKARNCVAGREALVRYCEEREIPFDCCGKVVIATRPEQLPALEELERRGKANGLTELRRLSPAEIREREPHAAGLEGLFVPQAGIVDYRQVAEAYAADVHDRGGDVLLAARLLASKVRGSLLVLETTRGDVRCRNLVNCAGLESDRVASLCGARPGVRIVPFRGEYYELKVDRRPLVSSLIYPVPNPEFPFLGVHFTRKISGTVEAGPNAVLAFKREGYRRTSFSLRDTLSTLTYGGFWRLAGKYWRAGLGELYRSWSRAAFVRALQELIPELRGEDLRPGGAGVRAQALDRDGTLLDDFHVVEGERQIHVLNAPSPAATASLAIGDAIAARAERSFGLVRRPDI